MYYMKFFLNIYVLELKNKQKKIFYKLIILTY